MFEGTLEPRQCLRVHGTLRVVSLMSFHATNVEEALIKVCFH